MGKLSTPERIKAATKKMDAAATHLERVVGEIKAAPRADKVAITDAVRDAFEKMRSAKSALERLQMMEDGGVPLRDAIVGSLRHARRSMTYLKQAREMLGVQRGDQVGEEKTAEQLDRWAAESALKDDLTTAEGHAERLAQVLAALEARITGDEVTCGPVTTDP
jgi:hypothetical protein